jgi:hypothetical protein
MRIQLGTTLHKPLYDTLCLLFYIIFDCRLNSKLNAHSELQNSTHYSETESESESESESYVTTDGQSASLSWNKEPIWGLRPDFYYCQTVGGFVDVGRPIRREDGSVIYNCCWPSPAQSFSGPSPVFVNRETKPSKHNSGPILHSYNLYF